AQHGAEQDSSGEDRRPQPRAASDVSQEHLWGGRGHPQHCCMKIASLHVACKPLHTLLRFVRQSHSRSVTRAHNEVMKERVDEPSDQTCGPAARRLRAIPDRKSTRLNSSHVSISYAVFCLKKKTE